MKINLDIVKEICYETISEYNINNDTSLNIDNVIDLTANSVCEHITNMVEGMNQEQMMYSLVSSIVALSVENFILNYKNQKNQE